MNKQAQSLHPTRRSAAMAMLLGGVSGTLPAWGSSDYPNRPIKLIVPYPPGGGIDLVARSYAEGLSRELAQTVVIDNRPGAATNIGMDATVKSAPDGYTLCIGSTGLVNNPHFGPRPGFDPLRDLAPIGLLTTMPFLIAAGPRSGIRDIRTLLERARAQPKSISIGSSLPTQVDITVRRAGIDLLYVPYKGGARAVVDAVAGQIDLVFGLLSVLIGQVQAGKLTLLAVADAKRSALAPEVPTYAEAGIPGYPPPSWAAVLAPAGTPAAILARLDTATQKVTRNPGFVATMGGQGFEVTHRSAAALAQMLTEQHAQSAALFQELQSGRAN